MLPTFSVNTNIYEKDKTKRVNEIMKDINELTCAWVGEAFIKIVEGKSPEHINLVSYAKSCEQNSKISQNNSSDICILNQEEIDGGNIGITDIVAEYVEDNIDDVIASLDMEYYVNSFLETREKLWFGNGQDIWRLLQLSKLDDKQAQNKLRVIMDEYSLRDLFYYVLTKSACYSKLEGILC